MTSPYRLFQFVNRFTKTPSSELINLTMISRIEVKKNTVQFIMAHEQSSFFGNFIIFNGGGNINKKICFNNSEEAEQEFYSIQEQLNNFYKQK